MSGRGRGGLRRVCDLFATRSCPQKDPTRVLERRREATRRAREGQYACGLIFTELLRSTGAEPEVLARVLRHEVQRGRVVYGAASSPDGEQRELDALPSRDRGVGP